MTVRGKFIKNEIPRVYLPSMRPCGSADSDNYTESCT